MIDEAGGAGRRATTDGGAVSGWEKGENLPHEWKRRELIKIASKNGRRDLADLISDPVQNWRESLRVSEDWRDMQLIRMITFLEIVAINASRRERSDPNYTDDEFELYYIALKETADMMRDKMIKKFGPDRTPTLLDDHQRQEWSRMVQEFSELQQSQNDRGVEGGEDGKD